MQTYKAPMKDIRFALESMGYDQVAALKQYHDYDLETLVSILEEAGKFCSQELLPLNRSSDQEGVHYDPETMEVKTAKGLKELYQRFCEGGYAAMAHPEE